MSMDYSLHCPLAPDASDCGSIRCIAPFQCRERMTRETAAMESAGVSLPASEQRDRDAVRIQAAVEAMMRALTRSGIGDNATLCLAAVGDVAGSPALASDVPEAALLTVSDVARAVIQSAGERQ